MIGKLRTAYAVTRREGPAGVYRALLKNLVRQAGIAPDFRRIRASIGESLREKYGNTVRHGPFKGMQLADSPHFSKGGAAAKILGHYERHVAERLVALADPGTDFIDVGAADGFFAVGIARMGLYRHCIAFEQSAQGQAVIAQARAANGLAEEVLAICGTATGAALREAIDPERRAVILIDIDGPEFELLDPDVLEHASHCTLIVELHDGMLRNGAVKKHALLERAARHFEIELMRSPPVLASDYAEVADLPDNYRLLAFSEGRPYAMEWLVLTPR